MEKITKVGFVEFTKYLQSLGSSLAPCSICGHEKWTLFSAADYKIQNATTTLSYTLPYGKIPSQPSDLPGELVLNNTMPILIKQCTSCGNMHFFNHNTVLEKINSTLGDGEGKGKTEDD